MHNTIVVALGGNAIKKAEKKATVEKQVRNIRKTCERIIDMIKKGYTVVITHGNGPQVGNLLLQQEAGSQIVSPQPLDILVAMTQGQIGYMIQHSLVNLLRRAELNIPIVTVLTQVLVDKNDPAFSDPSKPVGPFYTK